MIRVAGGGRAPSINGYKRGARKPRRVRRSRTRPGPGRRASAPGAPAGRRPRLASPPLRLAARPVAPDVPVPCADRAAPGARQRRGGTDATARPRAAAFVARGFGLPSWPEAYAAGRLVGLNEPYAYGYHRAEEHGFDVVYSHDAPERAPARLARLCVRALLGFDLVHAWRNRGLLDGVDVVWTHTESQSLAVAALRLLRPRAPRPRLLLQSVWLVDRWPRLGRARRALYRRLLDEADVLSFHTALAARAARALFPGVRLEVIPFGVALEERAPPRPRAEFAAGGAREARIVAIGNDEHRDWATLVGAFGSRPGYTVRVVSDTAPPRLLRGHANVRRMRPSDNVELIETLRWADLAVVPVRENLHASGITVLQELALRGVPAVASRAGGLNEYFDEEAVWYVPPGDPRALRETVRRMREDPALCAAKTERAARRMDERRLSSAAFVRRHVEISRELLDADAPPGPRGPTRAGISP